jgi:hypothetical protein
MLDPTTVGRTGRIPVITWNTPDGVDKLVTAKCRGVLFVKCDSQYEPWLLHRLLA